jgi:predicted transcriptional regulator
MAKATRRKVSEQLRAAIAEAADAGLTRYRIAKETGVSQAALSRFVNGKQGLDLASVDRLAEFLGLALTKVPENAKPIRTTSRSKG